MAKPIADQLGINIGLCLGVKSGHVFEPLNKEILITTPGSFMLNYCPTNKRGGALAPANHSPAKIKLAILDEADMIFQGSK